MYLPSRFRRKITYGVLRHDIANILAWCVKEGGNIVEVGLGYGQMTPKEYIEPPINGYVNKAGKERTSWLSREMPL